MSRLYRGRKNPLKRLHLLIGEFALIEGDKKSMHSFEFTGASRPRQQDEPWSRPRQRLARRIETR
jgi:hypothetical protein